jgi:glycosyltransferase involved in cell wall biosynthesis
MNRKMKVLIICKSLPYAYNGGIQTHVWQLSEALLDRGHSISILTAGSLLTGRTEENIGGRKIITIPHWPSITSPGIRHFAGDFSFNYAARVFVNRHASDYDVIHVQGRSGMLLWGLDIDTPIVTTVHRLYEVEKRWQNHDYQSAIDARLHQLLCTRNEAKIIKASRAVIAVSRQSAEELKTINLDLLKDNLHIISNGISPVKHVHQVEPNDRSLLFVGRLTRIKGIFNLIQAMKYINKEIQLTIVGEGPARKKLEQMIRDFGLERRVKLLGAKTYDAVCQLMASSFALILPSSHEAQGIVLLESNLQGRPVLASNCTGMKEVVKHGYNGLLFDPHNILDIARTTNSLFNNPERARIMGETGKSMVKHHFDWAQIAQETELVYRTAI